MNSTPELWNEFTMTKKIFEMAEAKKNHGIKLQLLHTEMIQNGNFELKGRPYWNPYHHYDRDSNPYHHYDDYKENDIYEHIWVTQYLRCITHYCGCLPTSYFDPGNDTYFWDDYDELGISISLREFRGNPFDDDDRE